MYITFEEYSQLYDPIEERLFNRFSFDAARVMDMHTTGIDNVKKLKLFLPTDANSAELIKRCAGDLIELMHQIHKTEMSVLDARGFESTEQGMHGKVISSVTSGNESITYSTGSATSTVSVDAAVKDKSDRDKMYANIVWQYLSGTEDANGVNLLYLGKYPRRYL